MPLKQRAVPTQQILKFDHPIFEEHYVGVYGVSD